MWIYISEQEYPEIASLLSSPNKRMNFLHDIECELAGKTGRIQPDSFMPIQQPVVNEQPKEVVREVIKETGNQEELNSVLNLLSGLGGAMDGLMKRMELLEKNPVVVQVANQEKVALEEEDFSDTTGIDFSQAIAMFED